MKIKVIAFASEMDDAEPVDTKVFTGNRDEILAQMSEFATGHSHWGVIAIEE